MTFRVDDLITTNGLNCFKILGVNDTEICVVDLITKDFSIFKKTEHRFAPADIRDILKKSLEEILGETDISVKDMKHVNLQMRIRIDNWININGRQGYSTSSVDGDKAS